MQDILGADAAVSQPWALDCRCHVEGFSGFEGKMKLGKVSGAGTVTLRDSGQASDFDISGDITVKVSWSHLRQGPAPSPA